MNPRFYKILSSEEDGSYLYEWVKSGGQQGVRCRIYISCQDLYKDYLDIYKEKHKNIILKNLYHRHPNTILKFESIVWCWPYDEFDYQLGKEMSRKRVDEKIKYKKNRLKRFIKHLEINNLPNIVQNYIENVRNI